MSPCTCLWFGLRGQYHANFQFFSSLRTFCFQPIWKFSKILTAFLTFKLTNPAFARYTVPQHGPRVSTKEIKHVHYLPSVQDVNRGFLLKENLRRVDATRYCRHLPAEAAKQRFLANDDRRLCKTVDRQNRKHFLKENGRVDVAAASALAQFQRRLRTGKSNRLVCHSIKFSTKIHTIWCITCAESFTRLPTNRRRVSAYRLSAFLVFGSGTSFCSDLLSGGCKLPV